MLSSLGTLGFERPGALWIALAMIPVIVLYFLRMRFKRVAVGSTYLWKALSAATSGGESLKRRSILLLILQIAAVALAAFAAAGPYLVSRRILEPGTVFIIDVSASMASRDCDGPRGPLSASRVEAAAAAARREIEALGPAVPVMAFACSGSALALLPGPSLDRAAASASLDRLAAGSESFAEARCSDGIAAWLARNEGAWRARLFTDGGLDLGGERLSATFGGQIAVVAFGSKSESVGATGLRLAADGRGGTRAGFTLWNGWPGPQSLRVRIARGGEKPVEAQVEAAPGWSRASVAFPGGARDGAYTLSLERRAGDLAAAPGGTCYLSVGQQRALSVLLAGRSDPFLIAALAFGGISYASVAAIPAELAAAGAGDKAGPDIAIAENAEVPALLRCNLLVFGAPPPDAPISIRGRVSGAIASTGKAHPLSRFVSWDGAKAEAGLGYELRGQATVLATVGGVPSIVAWEREGYRCLAVGIDLARSDLGLTSAFPILLANFFQWCVPPVDEQSAYTLVAGESARRAEPASFALRARGVETLRLGQVFELTAHEAGLFAWDAGAAKGWIAANVPASELDAGPRLLRIASGGPGSRTASAGIATGGGAALAASERTRLRSLGGAASVLLVLCLMAEWLAWKGRAPGLKRKAAPRARKGASV